MAIKKIGGMSMERDSLIIVLQKQNADTTVNPVIVDIIGWLFIVVLTIFIVLAIVFMVRLAFDL